MTQDPKIDFTGINPTQTGYDGAVDLTPRSLPEVLEPRPVSGRPESSQTEGHYANVASEIDERAKREATARKTINNIHAGLDAPPTPPPA